MRYLAILVALAASAAQAEQAPTPEAKIASFIESIGSKCLRDRESGLEICTGDSSMPRHLSFTLPIDIAREGESKDCTLEFYHAIRSRDTTYTLTCTNGLPKKFTEEDAGNIFRGVLSHTLTWIGQIKPVVLT